MYYTNVMQDLFGANLSYRSMLVSKLEVKLKESTTALAAVMHTQIIADSPLTGAYPMGT